ncbi:MAG: phosphate ABC transporter permease subunit PstC [Candidatus Nanopelagicales bacterium]
MSTLAQATPAAADDNPLRQVKARNGEKVIRVVLATAAAVSVATTFGIVLSLLVPSITFFSEIPITEFLFTTTWTPLFANPQYGVLPLIAGTFVITIIAISVAIPLGLGSAVYLSEFASSKVRRTVKPVLEVLEGVPTVVYGFFALEFMTQLVLRPLFPGIQVFNALSAGLVMGIMIIPTVASLAEDAMSAVPGGLRDGAYALGATKRQTALRVVIPAALSGIVAAFVLGISRAIGETMVVTVAAGLMPNLTLNPFEGMQTMTSYIAAAASGDVSTGSIEYQSIFAVGLLLFVITFAMNALSIRLVRKYRQTYQ